MHLTTGDVFLVLTSKGGHRYAREDLALCNFGRRLHAASTEAATEIAVNHVQNKYCEWCKREGENVGLKSRFAAEKGGFAREVRRSTWPKSCTMSTGCTALPVLSPICFVC